MPAMQNNSNQGLDEYRATGTFNSVNEAEGTVNISHGPVDAVGWPAMTMDFRLADPQSVAVLAPGQEIEFSFNTQDGATVTRVEPVD
jgi:Cu(I)/Ag(I) efflux system protein CusF